MVEKIKAERASAATGLRLEKWTDNTISFAGVKSRITFSTRTKFLMPILAYHYMQKKGLYLREL